MRCSFDEKQLSIILEGLIQYYDAEYDRLKSLNTGDRMWQQLDDVKTIIDTIDSFLSYSDESPN